MFIIQSLCLVVSCFLKALLWLPQNGTWIHRRPYILRPVREGLAGPCMTSADLWVLLVSWRCDWCIVWSVLLVPSGSGGPSLADSGPPQCALTCHTLHPVPDPHSHHSLCRQSPCEALGGALCHFLSSSLSLSPLRCHFYSAPRVPSGKQNISPLCFGFHLGFETIVPAPAIV